MKSFLILLALTLPVEAQHTQHAQHLQQAEVGGAGCVARSWSVCICRHLRDFNALAR